MIIYNVTINIAKTEEKRWLIWMRTKHIQEVLDTGKFISAKLIKVLVEDNPDTETYAIQYTTESRENLEDYYKNFAPKLRKEGQDLFGDKMLGFRTELQVLESYSHSN
jgi:hypothetical protein